MENKELNRVLKKFAKEHNMCEKVRRQWEREWSLDTMIEKFYRNIDFYLKERFIPKDFFKEGFGEKWLRQNGVLVDDEYSLMNPPTSILIGNSKSNIRYNGDSISTLYLTDNSEATITAKGKSFVMVHMLESSRINVEQQDKATVVVIKHSPSCRTKVSGNVKVKYELDYLS